MIQHSKLYNMHGMHPNLAQSPTPLPYEYDDTVRKEKQESCIPLKK